MLLCNTLILSILVTLVHGHPASKRATVCNGHAELCGRSYGNVTFIGAHDSYATSKDPLALARDQSVDIPTQLSLGARLLQAQSHMQDGQLHFCHTSCALFDGGTVQAYLSTVKTFLDANPNEVLTFVFTNPEGVSMNNVWLPAFQASGMDKLAFVPPQQPMPQSVWPTLGEMIDSGKRVVTFIDAGADKANDTVNFLIPEFPNVWETPFDSTDKNFPCKVDRSSGPLPDNQHLYMINHFLDVDVFGADLPDELAAGTTNGVDSILADANGCTQFAAGRAPNFVLLDWIDEGDAFKAGNTLNGLPN